MAWWGYLLILVALLAGIALGFFIARKYMMKLFEEKIHQSMNKCLK